MKFLEFWRRVERCGGGNHLCILQCHGGAGKLIGPPLSTFLEKYLMFPIPPPPPPPLPPRWLEKLKELAEEEGREGYFVEMSDVDVGVFPRLDTTKQSKLPG